MRPLPQIMVAPNGARLTTKDHSAVPVTIAKTVACAVACKEAGADGIHAHVRDAGQQHVLDAGAYRELIAETKQKLPDFYVQITTEAVGRYTPEEQRQLVADVDAEAVSIAVREMIVGQDDKVLRRFYHDTHAAGTAVQHILYDAGDVHKLADMVADGIVPSDHLQALIVLGRYAPGQRSTPSDLGKPANLLLTMLPYVDWAVCAFGAEETDCLLAARKMGGKARIGFENNRINRDLTCAKDNAERVRELVASLPEEKA
ncbi:BKACE family enzyme [Marivivens aquimaris]|uniref:3-keto-5-aminohexanoate cleavage protein n=1 Tax=Marivivens aquimaris TaxID=2774876 RepID=UPI001880B4A8|nr:3-keto-5-aminohexanoate cleavage protein [Marivivens aquimaris]